MGRKAEGHKLFRPYDGVAMRAFLFSICLLWTCCAQDPFSPFAPKKVEAAGGGGYNKIFDVGVGGTVGSCVTSATDTSGSTLIVIGVSYYLTLPTLSDSKGNTWQPLTAEGQTTASAKLYWCENPTVGSGHTFTLTGGDGVELATLSVIGFSGNAASPFDAESGDQVPNNATVQPGSITPAGSGEVFVTLLSFGNSTRTATIDSSFTSLSKLTAGGLVPASYLAYKIKVDTAAENPTWTLSDTAAASTVMAAFK